MNNEDKENAGTGFLILYGENVTDKGYQRYLLEKLVLPYMATYSTI